MDSSFLPPHAQFQRELRPGLLSSECSLTIPVKFLHLAALLCPTLPLCPPRSRQPPYSPRNSRNSSVACCSAVQSFTRSPNSVLLLALLREILSKPSTTISCAARRVGWLPDAKCNLYPKTNHVGFGLVLGSYGKRFCTRSSEVVRLVELLDEAKSRSKAELVRRTEDNGKLKEWTDEELEKTAEAVGYGAIKLWDHQRKLADCYCARQRQSS